MMRSRMLAVAIAMAAAGTLAASAIQYTVTMPDLFGSPGYPIGYDVGAGNVPVPPDAGLTAPPGYGYSCFEASVVNSSDGSSADPTAYRTLRLVIDANSGGTDYRLFGHALKVKDIAKMSLWTKKSTAYGASIDWRVSVYTKMQGAGDVGSWYRSRMQAHTGSDVLMPYAPANQWNQWSTAAGTNQVQFYDVQRFGYDGDLFTWSAITSGTVTAGADSWDYSNEDVLIVDVGLGANQGGGTGASQVDGIRIELASGEVADIDLAGRERFVNPAWTSSTNGWGVSRFKTIASAVSAAVANDSVVVAAGTYTEYIGITKALSLYGANAGIHPAVGMHATEVVGARGPETIINNTSAIVPSADNILIDGIKFTASGGRIVDTYANANGFVMRNCIFAVPTFHPSTGTIQFGGGSHTDMVLEFNLFQDKGDHTLYTGGGPFDRLRIAYNKFNVEGDSVFWSATTLVDGVIEGNEFDGTVGGIPGVGFGTINIGQAGNIQIRTNWFHDLCYTPFQAGIINGAVLKNTIERIYTYPGYGSRAFELWGGAWGTPISQNVLIECNTIHYNDVAAADPVHGIRLTPPVNPGDPSIDASTIHVHNNIFINGGARTDAYAIRHQGNSATAVDATGNWWGTTDLGSITTRVYGAANLTPVLTAPPPCSAGNALYLEPTLASIYVKPSETCVVDLKVANLEQPIVGLQALLGFSSTYFKSGEGEVGVAAGGGIWSDLIWGTWDAGGDLDVAVGVNLSPGVGTSADATTATMTLQPKGPEGRTTVVFRPDGESEVEITMLTSVLGLAVYPNTIDSAEIVIDGTQPTISSVTATEVQSGGTVNVKDSVNMTLQGVVNVAVAASDALAGLVGAPAVAITGPGPLAATYVSESPSGTFNYTIPVVAATSNGTYTVQVTATDKAGNVRTSSFTLLVNKNQIAGQVELEQFAGSSRVATFIASGGVSSKTYTVTLTGFTASKAAYALTDVPDGTSALSVKTAWSLRERQTFVPTDGQATLNFVGDGTSGWSDATDHYLRGGDLNGSNGINIQDYALLRSAWYTTNPAMDIDGNGAVTTVDYGLMQGNWFKTGDAP